MSEAAKAPEGWVSPEELAEKFVPKAELEEKYIPRSTHNAEMARVRLGNSEATEAARKALLSDDEFLKSIGKGGKFDRDAEIERITSEFVTPLKGELETWKSLARRGHIQEVARSAGVQDHFLREVDGQPPYVDTLLGKKVTHDPKHGWILTDGEGTPLGSGDPDKPYMTVDSLLAKRKGDPEWNFLFKQDEKAVGGSGYQNGESRSTRGRMSTRKRGEMSREEKAAWIAEAREKGVENPVEAFLALPE